MQTSQFVYDLPQKLIAQKPVKKRGTSNLLVLNKKTGQIEHKKYYDLPDYVEKGDVVVLNQTAVLKARVFAEVKRTNRQVEVLFLDKLYSSKKEEIIKKIKANNLDLPKQNADVKKQINFKDIEFWHALIGRARHVKNGDVLLVSENSNKTHQIYILFREKGDPGFIIGVSKGKKIMDQCGHVPLPPYIKRQDVPEDQLRYNTVFSKDKGSVAAPTASLNLTKNIIKRIEEKGAKIVYVKLNIGWGTFAPVNTEQIEEFDIHEEYIEVPAKTVNAINNCQGKIWAFGTTVVRTLESAATKKKQIKQFSGHTDLYIYPPYEFQIIDALITNFHAPKTSLLMLVSALGGIKNIKRAYEVAKKHNYRFLSYGDSMLIH